MPILVTSTESVVQDLGYFWTHYQPSLGSTNAEHPVFFVIKLSNITWIKSTSDYRSRNLFLFNEYPLGFEVFTAVKMIMFFWVLLQPWRWGQYVSPKRWHLPTSLHGAKTQRNNIIIKYPVVSKTSQIHTLCTPLYSSRINLQNQVIQQKCVGYL
jgi:hypothetical protein